MKIRSKKNREDTKHGFFERLHRHFMIKSFAMILSASMVSVAHADTHALEGHSLIKVIANKHQNAHQLVWNLKNADIRAVIQTVSQLTGKNFIIDPSVQGHVSLISHKPMDVKEIYQVFLSMLGQLNYTAVPVGGYIKIIPVAGAKQAVENLSTNKHPGSGDQAVIRVLHLNNVSAMQLIPVLQPMINDWGSVTAYDPSNSIILVGSASNIVKMVAIAKSLDSQGGNNVKMITLQHAGAKHVVDVLDHLKSSFKSLGHTWNVGFTADEANNTILLSGDASDEYLVESYIDRLDHLSANPQVTTQVIRLNYLTAKKVAPIVKKMLGDNKDAAVSAQNVSIEAEDDDNAVLVHAPMLEMATIKTLIHRIDTKPQQVLVQAIVVKIDEGLLDRLGVSWGSLDGAGNFVEGSVPIQMKITQGGIGFLPGNKFQAVIDALHQNSSTDVLAEPSILVLNNHKATISDGQNVPIVNRTYAAYGDNGTNGASGANGTPSLDPNLGTPFNTIQRKDVTLSLDVTPQISLNKELQLKIKQIDDSLAQEASGAQTDNPIINTSKINTSVLVHSGDVIVLGGLINHDREVIVSKVPLLGDIPILGNLFKHKKAVIRKQALLIFIRPTILNQRNALKKTSNKAYKSIRGQQIDFANGKKVTMKNSFAVLPPLGKTNSDKGQKSQTQVPSSNQVTNKNDEKSSSQQLRNLPQPVLTQPAKANHNQTQENSDNLVASKQLSTATQTENAARNQTQENSNNSVASQQQSKKLENAEYSDQSQVTKTQDTQTQALLTEEMKPKYQSNVTDNEGYSVLPSINGLSNQNTTQ